jgi:biopolymer transport protein ExbD
MTFAPTSFQQGAMAQMNITPLVGVMMALLVVFMVTLPMTNRAVPLDIRYGGCPGPPDETPPPLRVDIDAAGGVLVNDQPTPMSALHAVFATAQADATPQSASLLMNIDGEVDYQTVARVIAAGQDAGLVSVGFVKY